MDNTNSVPESKISQCSSVRKLKQSRLSFQVISAGAASSRTSVQPSVDLIECRKRKPSAEGIGIGNASKIGRVLQENEYVSKNEDYDLCVTGINELDDLAIEESNIPPSEQFKNKCSGDRRKVTKSRKSPFRKQNFDKILIKLPIGKKKNLPVGKKKSSKKHDYQFGSINTEQNPGKSITLHDTDSEGSSKDQVEEYKKNNLINKDTGCFLDSRQNQSQLTVAYSQELMSLPMHVEKEVGEEQEQKQETLQSSVPRNNDDHELQTGNVICLSDVETAQSAVNLSGSTSCKFETQNTGRARSVSDVDSSEEDIYMLCTPNTKSAANIEEVVKKLTPKQIARRQEYEKRKAIKKGEKEEKRRKLNEERKEKAREKEEQERQRRKEREEKEEQKRKEREEKDELKRKEREEKEEIKRKEREEKEKKRQAEIEQKNEDKRLKEKERKKKEEQKVEERKRKEEEKEAEEKRKQKVAQAFTSFFVKKTANCAGRVSDDENSLESSLGVSTSTTGISVVQQRFMPFCVKGDMRLAPVIRRTLGSEQKENLEQILYANRETSDCMLSGLYLELLKQEMHKPWRTGRTWNNEEDEEENDDVMVVDDSVCHQIEVNPGKLQQKLRAKFFLFEENRRPPFRGTWRKKSVCIGARRPFAQDTKYFDYEIDSDDEWEEDEPGESLHGSDDEKDLDPEEDYEVDNEFFVPHGHLSDEELQAEGEGELDDNSPETQKAKLKIMQQEFANEMKKKTEKIKPMLIGCIWETLEKNEQTESKDREKECSAIIWKMLNDRAMLYDPDEPISFTLLHSPSSTNRNVVTQDMEISSPGKENEKGPKKVRITDDAVKDLVRLVHGNVNNRKFLVREFQTFWSNRHNAYDKDSVEIDEEKRINIPVTGTIVEFSLESIRTKIREIAQWGACPLEGPMKGKLCWTVDKDVLAMHDLQSLNMPNDWKYHLKGNTQAKLRKESSNARNEQERKSITPKKLGAAKNVTKLKNDRIARVSANSGAAPLVSMKKFTKVLSEEKEIKQLPLSINSSRTGAVGHLGQEKASLEEFQLSSTSGGKSIEGLCQIQKPAQLLKPVPRCETINQSPKTNLISNFLTNSSGKLGKTLLNEKNQSNTDEVIEIDSS